MGSVLNSSLFKVGRHHWSYIVRFFTRTFCLEFVTCVSCKISSNLVKVFQPSYRVQVVAALWKSVPLSHDDDSVVFLDKIS